MKYLIRQIVHGFGPPETNNYSTGIVGLAHLKDGLTRLCFGFLVIRI